MQTHLKYTHTHRRCSGAAACGLRVRVHSIGSSAGVVVAAAAMRFGTCVCECIVPDRIATGARAHERMRPYTHSYMYILRLKHIRIAFTPPPRGFRWARRRGKRQKGLGPSSRHRPFSSPLEDRTKTTAKCESAGSRQYL